MAVNAAEFSQWLSEHEETGGTLRLENNIEWSDYLNISAESPITIDAGAHSIHLNHRSYLSLSGPVTVQGSPVGQPLFDGEDESQLSLSDGALATVYGDNTVAVRIRWDQGFTSYFGSIHANGRQATALQAAGIANFSVSQAHITAEGENAVGVDASEGSVSIFFSMIEAAGTGAQSVISGKGGSVDVSLCSPEPKTGSITAPSEKAAILIAEGNKNFFYQSIKSPEISPMQLELLFSGEDQTLHFPVIWKPNTQPPAVPGTYTVTGTLGIPDDFMPLLAGFEPNLTVEMLDPDKPYLQPEYRTNASGHFVIPYYRHILDENAWLQVYLSEDRGRTWTAVEPVSAVDDAESYFYWGPRNIVFKNYFKPETAYLLKMEAEAEEVSGVSNILELYFSSDGDLHIKTIDGDRDFSDREDGIVTTAPGTPDTEPGTTDAADPPHTYSQSQIRELAETNPAFVTFFGEEIQASVDSGWLSALLPESTDTLSVRLCPLGGHSYRIEFLKNGTEPVSFSDRPLRVRLNCHLRENEVIEQLSFKSETGAAATIISYNAEAGQLEILVSQAGTYTLTSAWTAPPAQDSAASSLPAFNPLWLLPGIFIILALLFWRQKRKTV